MKEPVYTLTVSSSQALLIAQALDFWCRIHAGQLEYLRDAARTEFSEVWDVNGLVYSAPIPPRLSGDGKLFWKIDHAALEVAIKALRREMFPWLPGGASDLSFKGGREAFNLRKVIEHCVSWHERPLKPGEFQTVNYDGPVAHWWETPFEATMAVVADEPVRKRTHRAKAVEP